MLAEITQLNDYDFPSQTPTINFAIKEFEVNIEDAESTSENRYLNNYLYKTCFTVMYI